MDTYKKDIKATILNQIFKVFCGPLLLIFIPLYLSDVEQGYWYTFTSIAALVIFADLGFTNIVLQFAAHEFAYLSFDESSNIIGDKEYINRLSSFFRFSMKWLIKVVLVVFPLIIIGGYFFLESKGNLVSWKWAWILYSLSSVLVFVNSIILSFFEGCNSVSKIQVIRLKTSLCTSLVSICGLYFGIHLYALSFSLLFSSLFGSYMIYKNFYPSIKQFWIYSANYQYDWYPQFIALIWRYAISWCSGYFIFQLFTPLAFMFHGPEFAGKIGISIAMWMAGFGIASSWITAITPKMNILIEEQNWRELDTVFNKNLVRAMLTMLVGGSVFFGLYFAFKGKYGFFNRVLDFTNMFILFVCWLAQLFINSVAIYLRSHKKEPMMLISLFSAFYISITTFVCARFLSEEFLFTGFLTSFVYGVPFVIYLQRSEKKLHHKMEEK